jgi:transcriptional regulator
MYLPKNLTMTPNSAVRSFISQYNFGALITSDLRTTQLPFMVEERDDGKLVLTAHMAKANSQWKQFESSADSKVNASVLFAGPHAYISPTWYQSRPAVSTWNYASVQCFGSVTLFDEAATLDAVYKLTQQFEPSLERGAKAIEALMPEEYVNKLIKAVVGFEMVVETVEAKEKLGQHKSDDDQASVFNALTKSESLDAQALAAYMVKRNTGTGQS